jgi:TPR repeat protein
MRGLFFAVGVLALSATAAFAGAFENGAAAWKRGDFRTAMEDWRGLSQTDSTIQNNFGIMYKDGKGVAQNYSVALQWFSRSAAQGNSLGQNNLGGVYRDGMGVPRDYGRAITFFRAAAQQGNAAAQVNLGMMLLNGQGTNPDPASAYMWFDLAASQGVTQAAAERSLARQRMSNTQVQQASMASQRCRANNFKNCAV